MNDFGYVFENEIQKTFTAKRMMTTIAVIVAAAIVMALSLLGGPSKENWRQYVNKQIEESQNWIAELSTDLNENRDLIVEEQQQIALFQYRLENDYPPTESVFLFVFDAFAMETVLILLCVITAVFVVCNEYTNRTILPLLTSGDKRQSIILAKLLTALIYVTGVLVAYIVVAVVIGCLFFAGNGFSTTYLVVENGTIVNKDIVGQILGAVVIEFLRLTTYTLLAVMVATLVKNQTTAAIIVIGVWIFGGALISMSSVDYRWMQLFILHSLEVLGSAITTHIDWGSKELNRALLMCIVYSVLFGGAGTLCFCKIPLPKKYR